MCGGLPRAKLTRSDQDELVTSAAAGRSSGGTQLTVVRPPTFFAPARGLSFTFSVAFGWASLRVFLDTFQRRSQRGSLRVFLKHFLLDNLVQILNTIFRSLQGNTQYFALYGATKFIRQPSFSDSPTSSLSVLSQSTSSSLFLSTARFERAALLLFFSRILQRRSSMPFRTYCYAHAVPSTGPLDFLLSTHHRNAEASLDDGYITAFSLAAERRQHLFGLI